VTPIRSTLFCSVLAVALSCSGTGGTAGAVGGGDGTDAGGGGTGGGTESNDGGTGDAGVDGGSEADAGFDCGPDGGSGINQAPVAVLKVCPTSGAACSMTTVSVNLSSLPMGPNGTRLLTLLGTDSYDPPCNTMPLPFYRFNLVGKPSNATESMLENNGLKNAKSAVELTLDGSASGLYRIALDAWDDLDLRSANPSELKINANP
jgi:hypothetical protein